MHFVRIFAVLLMLLYGCTAFAQFNKEATLVVKPELPDPDEPFTVLLDAYAIDLTGASITWTVDGEKVPGTENARKITLVGPEFGKTIVVGVSVSNSNRGAFSLKKSVTSNLIDLIVEADTHTPSFYRGRALPSAGANVRAVAVPLVSHDAASALTYRWELGTKVLLGGPVRGRNVVEVPVPQYSTDVLSVSAVDVNGVLKGKRSVILTPYEPEIVFYEENPLRGLIERAITDKLVLIGEQTTIYGEPYNMARSNTRENSYTWTINGSPTQTANANPRSITIEKNTTSGSARVQMRAVGGGAVPQFIEKFFSVTF